MPEMEGFKKVQETLRKLASKYGNMKRVSVIVGYTAKYAIHVHENIEMKGKGLPRTGMRWSRENKRTGISIYKAAKGFYWDPQGKAQAKFLEQPARELRKEFARIITTACSNGATIEQALLAAGLRLQRVSQQLVPVDTGNLRASAFTRKETGVV